MLFVLRVFATLLYLEAEVSLFLVEAFCLFEGVVDLTSFLHVAEGLVMVRCLNCLGVD